MAFDDTGELGRITAPPLLIWGDRDATVSRQEQERLAAAIPHTRLLSYPETGHSPHWERPERVTVNLHALMQEGLALAIPSGADGFRRIVWMINRMIKNHP
jgi:non-heme chloroperoxidase